LNYYYKTINESKYQKQLNNGKTRVHLA